MFNTKIDIATAIGAVFYQPYMLENAVANDASLHTSTITREFANLTTDKQATITEYTEERFLAQHTFLLNSGKQHAHLKQSLEEDFTKGNDNYPVTCQDVLRMLDKFSKSSVSNALVVSQGTAFAQ